MSDTPPHRPLHSPISEPSRNVRQTQNNLSIDDISDFSTSRFREERESEWIEFDQLLTQLERHSARAVSSADLLRLPILYRTTLSSLSIARATNLDRALLDYLESLARRGYFYLYGVGEKRTTAIARFFQAEWPAAMCGLWRETLLAGAILFLGIITAWAMVASEPEWFYHFVPKEAASGRDPDASVDFLRDSIGYGVNVQKQTFQENLSVFAAYLFTHNSMVAIFAFSLGFAFGIPTMILLYYNGLTLGAMIAVFANKGLGVDFIGWLSIHGTSELFAIILAGAAGLRIGNAVLYPGNQSRLIAAAQGGKMAGTAMIGVLIMLLVAGLLEGFARQMITDVTSRYAIGGAFLFLWLGYYYIGTGNNLTQPESNQNSSPNIKRQE